VTSGLLRSPETIFSVNWMVSISNKGTFAGVDVVVTVSAAGDMDTVIEGAELCAVASAAQASERMNDIDMVTRNARYQKDGDETKHDLYI
jgi:hypothetical protein